MNKDGSTEAQFKLNRTGLIYDPIMLDFDCQWDPQYPEKPDRIKKPYERCQFYGLTEKCVPIGGRFCTDQEVEKCHTARVNQLMKDSAKMSVDELKHLSTIYDSMFWHQNSDKAARFALGSSLELVDHIMDGKVENGFAIIRPPGHHAMHDEPNGYCYFNNASIAAKHAIEKYNLERVLIIDWDVHHGQGTQYLFYDDPKVLYVSWHRYDYGEFWPNLRKSDFDHIGEGAGKGYNINIPLNKIGLGNSEYASSFHNVILPIAYEYNPQLVIVSCGYDAAIGCFEGKMKVTPAGYAHFINALSCLSNGKLCVLLEGGYCIKSLSEGVALTLRALLGYPTPRIEEFLSPDPIFVVTLRNLISVLRPHWKCLQNLNDNDESIKLADYLEKWDVENRKNRNIKFFDLNDRPESFPLTGFYPLYSDEENVRLDLEIDDLIKTTDLSFPRNKTCVSIGDPAFKNSIKEANLKSSGEIAYERMSQSVLGVVDSICQKNFMNGLVVSNEASIIDVANAVNHAKSKYTQIEKVLIVNLSKENLFDKSAGNGQEDLLVSFSKNDVQDLASNRISVQLGDHLQDIDYLTAFWRILIPVAYQFNPDLVFLFVDAKTPISASGLGQITRILNSLANGNLVVAFQSPSSNADDESKLKVEKCLSILLGNPCDQLDKMAPSDKLQKAIKDQILNFKAKWPCFQFNDKLPSE